MGIRSQVVDDDELAGAGETLVSTTRHKIVRDLPEPAVLTGGLLSSRPVLIDP